MAAVSDLLAMVPAEYDTALYIDLANILQDSTLTDTLERIGVIAVLGPAAGPIQEQVDSMVLAQVGSRALGVLSGQLDGQRLVDSLKSPNSEVESEVYGAFEIL